MKVLIFDLDDTLFDSTGQDPNDKDLSIQPFPGVPEFLSACPHKKILVTRGVLSLQNRKIKKLGIKDYFDEIYICENDEGKWEIFQNILEKHSSQKPHDFIVIGNRIDCEIRYGRMLDVRTVHLKHGKYKDLTPKDTYEVAQYVIDEFFQFPNILKNIL